MQMFSCGGCPLEVPLLCVEVWACQWYGPGGGGQDNKMMIGPVDIVAL